MALLDMYLMEILPKLHMDIIVLFCDLRTSKFTLSCLSLSVMLAMESSLSSERSHF